MTLLKVCVCVCVCGCIACSKAEEVGHKKSNLGAG